MGKLKPKDHDRFKTDCKDMSDPELARKYLLNERTATNWRIRLYGKRCKEETA